MDEEELRNSLKTGYSFYCDHCRRGVGNENTRRCPICGGQVRKMTSRDKGGPVR